MGETSRGSEKAPIQSTVSWLDYIVICWVVNDRKIAINRRGLVLTGPRLGLKVIITFVNILI